MFQEPGLRYKNCKSSNFIGSLLVIFIYLYLTLACLAVDGGGRLSEWNGLSQHS